MRHKICRRNILSFLPAFKMTIKEELNNCKKTYLPPLPVTPFLFSKFKSYCHLHEPCPCQCPTDRKTGYFCQLYKYIKRPTTFSFSRNTCVIQNEGWEEKRKRVWIRKRQMMQGKGREEHYKRKEKKSGRGREDRLRGVNNNAFLNPFSTLPPPPNPRALIYDDGASSQTNAPECSRRPDEKWTNYPG